MTIKEAKKILAKYETLKPNSHYFEGKLEKDFEKLRKQAQTAIKVLFCK
jgi:hypothetical protein